MADLIVGVDGSNLFQCGSRFSQYIETHYVAGLYNKQSRFRDETWRLNFHKFSKLLVGEDKLVGGHFVAVVNNEKELIKANLVRGTNMECSVFQRDENGVSPVNDDQYLTDQVVTLLENFPGEPSTLRFVSSDRDYLPLYEYAGELGWTVEVWGFGYAMSSFLLSSPLIDKFVFLEDHFNSFSFYKRPWRPIPRDVADSYLSNQEA